MNLRTFVAFGVCFIFIGCSSTEFHPKDLPPVQDNLIIQDETPVEDTEPIEDTKSLNPCLPGPTPTIAAGKWSNSGFATFGSLEDDAQPEIEFGSQGGVMMRFDLLAQGTGNTATDLKIQIFSLDKGTTHHTSEFGSVSFSCQETHGQLLVNMTVEVDGVPFDKPLLLALEANVTDQNNDLILIKWETEVTITF